MTESRWAEVERWIARHLLPHDPGLTALERSREAGIPEIQVEPPIGKLLELLARAIRAQRILEIGTLTGYSTIWLAHALPPDGHLVTLEADRARATLAHANLREAGVGDRVDLRVGPALDTLSQLAAESPEPFDLVFIDADKANHDRYLGWALRLTRPGSLIIADNVVRGGAVVDEQSEDPSVRGVRRFMERLGAEPGLAATALQTLGSKGYDGLAIALVL